MTMELIVQKKLLCWIQCRFNYFQAYIDVFLNETTTKQQKLEEKV